MAQDLTKVINPEQYQVIAEDYSNLIDYMTVASVYLYNACNEIVLSTEFEPTLDLLQTFYDVYVSQRKTLLDSTPFLPAVRVLNNHVLLRATDDAGVAFASINDWMGNIRVTVPSFAVPQEWADLSAAAGYTIDNAYIA